MNRGACRKKITAVGGVLFCFLTIAGDLRGQDQARAILAKGQFTGGVVAHVHGADASLLRSMRQESPNLLGHLLVARETDARRARETLVADGLHGTAGHSAW